MDAVGERAGRAIDVEDRRLRLLAHSAHDGPVDAVRRDTILRRAAPPAVAERIERLELRRAHGPVRVPAAPELAMGARVCFPLRDGAHLLGFAWVLDQPPLGDDEVQQLATGLAAVARALAALAAAEDARGGREQAALDALLDADAPERREDAAAGALAGGLLESTATYRVLVAAAGADLGPMRRAAGTGRVVTGAIGGHAVAVVAGPPPEPGAGTGVPFGVGEPVASLADAHESHRQAVLARRVALAVPALGPVARFAALGPYGLLAPLAFPAGAAQEPTTRPAALVALHAAPDGEELLRTLRAALDAAGDATRAASALQVHRATLYRRLRRVERLTGTDLADGHQRLHLHAALLLDELR